MISSRRLHRFRAFRLFAAWFFARRFYGTVLLGEHRAPVCPKFGRRRKVELLGRCILICLLLPAHVRYTEVTGSVAASPAPPIWFQVGGVFLCLLFCFFGCSSPASRRRCMFSWVLFSRFFRFRLAVTVRTIIRITRNAETESAKVEKTRYVMRPEAAMLWYSS